MKKAKYENVKWLAEQQKINNPKNEPVGPFTGRCRCCGSKDLWDDASFYGCNNCGRLKC